jgi:hypothetical protein
MVLRSTASCCPSQSAVRCSVDRSRSCARSWISIWSPTSMSKTSPRRRGKPSTAYFSAKKTSSNSTIRSCKGLPSAITHRSSNALRKYAKQPTGVFHALPLARGKSIMNSNWIGDLGQFYGMNLFMAETSATSGGLDSLLEPTGSLKLAQEYAARAFGSRRTFPRHQRHINGQQDRRPGHRPARRHRSG